MKTRTLHLLLALSVVTNILLLTSVPTGMPDRTVPQPPASGYEEQDWSTFITALAWVESRWNDNAESPKEAVGYLQLTPILVKDVNRIVGKEAYTLEERTDRKKSIEMFNIIMDNYNPQHDMQYALKIWNPYAKVSYHRAVMKKYQELKSI